MSRTRTEIAVGPSGLAWQGDALVVEIDEIAVPLPRRIKGRIVLRPSALTKKSFALDREQKHFWWPMAPSAQIEVDFERPSLHWRGHGYLDTNYGSLPLEDSFKSWNWSRAHIGDETAILYDVVPREGKERGLALRFDSAGASEVFAPPPVQPLPKGLWRVARSTRVESGHEARLMSSFEDAPFYLRSTIATRLLGQATTAVHESLSLTRFDTTWVKALLPFRMPRAVG